MENLRFALRYLLKRRGNNLIRVISLTLGLAVGVVIFSYVHYLLTFDRFFPERERIYQVWSRGNYGMNDQMIAPLAPALMEEFPSVEAATRLKEAYRDEFFHDDRPYDVRYLPVDTMFFDVLDYGVVQGDAKQLRGRDRIMLSQSLARTIFMDRDPMGQVLLLRNEEPMTVVGVFRDPPCNTHLGRFSALVPFETLSGKLYMDWDGGDSFPTYVKLREGTGPRDFESYLPTFLKRHGLQEQVEQWGEHYMLVPITRSATTGSGVVMISWILVGLALLILFVTAMNYALISISTLFWRARTFAMMRCNGARRGDIRRIFLWETALVVGVSTVVAAFLIWTLQGMLERFTGVPLLALFTAGRLWVPALVVVVAFVLAGALPAQIFASIPLATAFRSSGGNRRRWKRALLIVQLACSTLALTMLTVFTLQVHHLRHEILGFDPAAVVVASPKGSLDRIRALEEELASMPEVAAAGSTSSMPAWTYSGQPCFDEQTGELLFGARVAWIDENYVPAIGMEMAAGRNFTIHTRPLDVLVNETYASKRGWMPEEAVGHRILCYSGTGAPLYTIVGVVRDFRTLIELGEVEPIVLRHFSDLGTAYTKKYTCIRLHAASPEARAAVQRKIDGYPSENNHRLWSLEEEVDGMLSTETGIERIVRMVAVVVLLITLIGLAGYVGDEISRRAKEVAIRKVNGASPTDVIRLFARRTAVPVLPAIVVGLALAYFASTQVLQIFSSRIRLHAWIFIAVAAAVATVVYAVLYVRSHRIAHTDPAHYLNAE